MGVFAEIQTQAPDNRGRLLARSMLLSILASSSMGASAAVHEATPCGLPVCSIEDELRIMEEKGQSYRFQTLAKFRQTFSKEKNEQNLNNLLAFSRASLNLITRLNDEDYVLREAKGLKDQTLFLLMQWVWRDCRRLSDGYSELAGETQRFATLDFFVRRAGSLTDTAEIRELTCFAGRAESISMEKGDSDYVARHAVQLGAGLSTQLLETINGWEGAFKIDRIDGPLAQDLENLTLILFSTGGELGIVASLSHSDIRPTVFQKLNFNDNPQFLTSRQSFASAVPSVLNLKFSDTLDSIQGTLLEPIRFERINFTARRKAAVAGITTSPCSESDISGHYQSQFSDLSGTVAIEMIGPQQWAANFTSRNDSLSLPFPFGRYNPSTGRLTFVNLQTNVPLGWRLIAEKDATGACNIHGWGLSTFTGAYYPLVLRRMNRK